jgi:chromosomal replication initiation ATPase DnaA
MSLPLEAQVAAPSAPTLVHPAPHPSAPDLLRRIERSVPAALDIVTRLDEAADAEQREITRLLARQILENEGETLNLFE